MTVSDNTEIEKEVAVGAPSSAVIASGTVSDVEGRMQFSHPEKRFALWQLPGLSERDTSLLAAAFGVSVDTYASIREGFRQAARATATELLEDADFRAEVDRLPLREGDVIVAFGDSITDDYQSWAEIFRHLLELERPADRIRVVNLGMSGDATPDLIRRLWQVASFAPRWLVTMIGTNDARRDCVSGEMLVTHEETARNLAIIGRWALAADIPNLVWLTPSPVVEGRIAIDPDPTKSLQWLNSDLTEKAAAMRSQAGVVIEVGAAFGWPVPGQLLLPDGLHPSLAGQRRILVALVEGLNRALEKGV